MSSKRPEHQAPAEIFYGETEANKYTSNSRIIEIQSELTERALELLNLPEDQPSLLLDVGCGSGLSGEVVSESGHSWIGLDISEHMLDVALKREVEGDLILSDMGDGVPFRPGVFDGVVSISALQWLCNADKGCHRAGSRLNRFFTMLYSIMSCGARAVFQFYPENDRQLDFILTQSIKAGFRGGLVVDYPNSTKAKKIFLLIYTGGAPQVLPQGKGVEGEQTVEYSRKRKKDMKDSNAKKSKDWILAKKRRRERQGKEVRPDSKYTARKRSGKL